MKRLFVFGLLLCGLNGLFATEFAANKMFGSHMVLQQGKPIRFAGTAPAGRNLDLTFAGKTCRTSADDKGCWLAEFPAMKAGSTPYSLTIADGKDKIVFSDILIGEVWVCSGQSNMEMPVRHARNRFFSAQNADAEVKQANYPQIRLLTVGKATSVTPEKDIRTQGWKVCTPENTAPFSACAYFFGRELNRELNVPVGLISANWGGSAILPWIGEDAIESGDPLQYEKIVSLKKDGGDFSSFFKQFSQMSRELNKIIRKADGKKAAETWNSAGFDDSGWKTFQNGDSIPADGIYWLRTSFRVPENLKGKTVRLNLGKISVAQVTRTGNNYMEIYVNGKLIWKTNLNDAYTFFPNLPGGNLSADVLKEKNTVAVRLISLTGKPVFAGKNVPAVSCGGTSISLQNWKIEPEVKGIELPAIANFRLFDLKQPSLLFNGMIAPLGAGNIRGVIWYQGEADAGNPRYWLWHKLLIENWRAHWRDAEMPFLLVQLAGFEKQNLRNPLPDNYWEKVPPFTNGGWPITREIQAEMPKIFRNVGMAVAMDVGEHSNIHPADKQTVGFRLAKLAEKIAYGKDIVCAGPVFSRVEFDGGKAIVHFDNIGGGLTTKDGKAPGAFVLEHRPQKKVVLVPATAKIVGDTVEVTAPGVTMATGVRYAFATYRGDVNLMNKAGFPAVPFRSIKTDYAQRHTK